MLFYLLNSKNVLQNLKKTVNDFSRSCTVDDIINTVTITAIQTQQELLNTTITI